MRVERAAGRGGTGGQQSRLPPAAAVGAASAVPPAELAGWLQFATDHAVDDPSEPPAIPIGCSVNRSAHLWVCSRMSWPSDRFLPSRSPSCRSRHAGYGTRGEEACEERRQQLQALCRCVQGEQGRQRRSAPYRSAIPELPSKGPSMRIHRGRSHGFYSLLLPVRLRLPACCRQEPGHDLHQALHAHPRVV